MHWIVLENLKDNLRSLEIYLALCYLCHPFVHSLAFYMDNLVEVLKTAYSFLAVGALRTNVDRGYFQLSYLEVDDTYLDCCSSLVHLAHIH